MTSTKDVETTETPSKQSRYMTPAEKKEVISLIKSGDWSRLEIANKLNRNPASITRFLQRVNTLSTELKSFQDNRTDVLDNQVLNDLAIDKRLSDYYLSMDDTTFEAIPDAQKVKLKLACNIGAGTKIDKQVVINNNLQVNTTISFSDLLAERLQLVEEEQAKTVDITPNNDDVLPPDKQETGKG